MNELERFLAVVRFEEPDYWPLFGGHALGSPHKGALPKLHAQGLPERIQGRDYDAWFAYWGACTLDLAGSIGVVAARCTNPACLGTA